MPAESTVHHPWSSTAGSSERASAPAAGADPASSPGGSNQDHRWTPVAYRSHRFACAEPSAADGSSSAPGNPSAGATAAPALTSADYPVERSLHQADALAVALRGALHRIALPLAAAAAAFIEARGWTAFGHARLADHARERFGRSGRWVHDLAELGAALRRLPALAAALTGEDGGGPLGVVSARVVGSIATAESLPRWVELARCVPVRELRRRVRAARDGDGEPGATTDESTAMRSTDCPAEDEDLPRRHVVLAAPASLRPAFDEALELFRAVEGHQSTLTAFLEALVAEGLCGDAPADVSDVSLQRTSGRDAVEAALERSTDRWQIRALQCLHHEMEVRLGRLLHEMGERRAWSRLRFAGVGHYAERRLGLSRTAMEDRVRLARALDRLPRLRRAHQEGRVGYEAARCVVRILGPGPVDAAMERRWVERAAEATVKRLQDEGRALRREGDRGCGEPLEDSAWHESLRRDPGTARQRVLRLGMMAALEPVSDVFLRFRVPDSLAEDLLLSIEAARSALTAEVEQVPWDEPWPEAAPLPSVAAARMFSVRARRVPAWVGLLKLIEDFVLTWDSNAGRRMPSGQAVFARDGWRCMAPGCTSRRHLEDHHVTYRSQGGGNELANRVCLCRFHHQRGEHGGLLRCRGRAPLGLSWRLGRCELAQEFLNERSVDEGEGFLPGC